MKQTNKVAQSPALDYEYTNQLSYTWGGFRQTPLLLMAVRHARSMMPILCTRGHFRGTPCLRSLPTPQESTAFVYLTPRALTLSLRRLLLPPLQFLTLQSQHLQTFQNDIQPTPLNTPRRPSRPLRSRTGISPPSTAIVTNLASQPLKGMRHAPSRGHHQDRS